jgi:sporulation protein YlmC with PRC-barrel domain
MTVAHALSGRLVSLAALLGTDVKDPTGRSIGRLSDVVVHWTTRGAYPRVRAIVLKTREGEFLIGAKWCPSGAARRPAARGTAPNRLGLPLAELAAMRRGRGLRGPKRDRRLQMRGF